MSFSLSQIKHGFFIFLSSFFYWLSIRFLERLTLFALRVDRIVCPFIDKDEEFLFVPENDEFCILRKHARQKYFSLVNS